MVTIVTLHPGGLEVTFSKGNSDLKLEDRTWERMEKEIKKKEEGSRSAGGREDGKEVSWDKLVKGSRGGTCLGLPSSWEKSPRHS